MDVTAIVAAAIAVVFTLASSWAVAKATHTGTVKSSNAETIFQASESVRNDLATELVACRKDRDTYAEQLSECLERRRARQ